MATSVHGILDSFVEGDERDKLHEQKTGCKLRMVQAQIQQQHLKAASIAGVPAVEGWPSQRQDRICCKACKQRQSIQNEVTHQKASEAPLASVGSPEQTQAVKKFGLKLER